MALRDTGGVVVMDTALVLEGGGMRGIYTTGVLDAFLDDRLYFDYVIGTSAGASHALSYLSRQKGRARRVNVDYCRRHDYMGLSCLLKEKSLFGMDLLFRKIPFLLDLYDFETFEQNAGRYYAVATNLLTGKPDYLAPRKACEVLPSAQASCSLPFVSRPVRIGGVPYLDGGIGDSIPVGKALSDGCKKAVVVLTQPAGYRKGSTKGRAMIRAAYSLECRNEAYNSELDLVERLEAEGRVLVIRPQMQPGLKRLERNPVLLNGLHKSGYEDARAILSRIRKFAS